MRRRDVLLAGVGGLATSVAGCTAVEETIDEAGDLVGDSSDQFVTGWSTYRGDPARSGVRSADDGPGESLDIAWEVTNEDALEERHELAVEDLEIQTVFGSYTSWPVIHEELVLYTQTFNWVDPDDGSTYDRALIAVDVADGSIAWTLDLSVGEAGPLGIDSWFAPELDDGRLYVPTMTADDALEMAVIDPDVGETTDRFDLDLSLFVGQPVVRDGAVYVHARENENVGNNAAEDGGKIAAYDLETGRRDWDVPAPRPRSGWPTLTVTEESIVHFESGADPSMVAIDREDGTERWREWIDLPDRLVDERPTRLSSPTVSEDHVLAGGDLEPFVQFDVAPAVALDREDGRERWQYDPPGVDGDDHPAAQLNPDLAPSEIEALPPFSAVYGQPVSVGDSIITTGIGEFDGAADEYCLSLDPETGAREWAVAIGSPSFAPVVAGDVIYLVTADGVEAISTNGEHLRRLDLPSLTQPEFSPALHDGRLFVPTIDGITALE